MYTMCGRPSQKMVVSYYSSSQVVLTRINLLFHHIYWMLFVANVVQSLLTINREPKAFVSQKNTVARRFIGVISLVTEIHLPYVNRWS